MKFNIGDKVVVSHEDDSKEIGEITNYKYSDLHCTNLYNIKTEKHHWHNIKEKQLKPFTPKDLLKDGVVVTFRNGDRWIYYADTLCSVDSSIHNFNAKFDNELMYVGDNGWDIIKLEFDGKVIWER